MRQSRVAGVVRTRGPGLWVLTAGLGFAFSGVFTGCGSDSNSGDLVKADPVVEQQVKSMSDYYKTNKPGATRRK